MQNRHNYVAVPNILKRMAKKGKCDTEKTGFDVVGILEAD